MMHSISFPVHVWDCDGENHYIEIDVDINEGKFKSISARCSHEKDGREELCWKGQIGDEDV